MYGWPTTTITTDPNYAYCPKVVRRQRLDQSTEDGEVSEDEDVWVSPGLGFLTNILTASSTTSFLS
jgi:hypothetical protein